MAAEDVIAYHFYGGFHFDLQTGRITHALRAIDLTLTKTDATVLVAFLKRPRMTIARTSSIVFGSRRSDRRLDDCVLALKRKLGLKRDELIVGVRGVGYKLDTDDVRAVYRSNLEATRVLAAAADLNFNSHQIELLRRSRQQAAAAIVKDPSNLGNYITAAYDCLNLAHGVFAAEWPSEMMSEARLRANQALGIAANFGPAMGILGLVAWIYDYDWREAERLLKRSIELNPRDSGALLSYAYLLVCLNRATEAFNVMETAVLAEPEDRIVRAARGLIHLWGGDVQGAITIGQLTVELDPSFGSGHEILGQAYEAAGLNEAALTEFETALRIDQTPLSISSLGHVCTTLDKREIAKTCMTELYSMHERGQIRYVPMFCVATIQVGLGDHNQALASLEKAYTQRCDWLVFLGVEPRWKPIRECAAFRTLMTKVGVPPEQVRSS